MLINANGNSKKFVSDRDPLFDFDASVRSVMLSLTSFTCDTYVLLSSGDVYPDQSSAKLTAEDSLIRPEDISRYGLHKFLAEQLVRGHHRNWLIMRMGGFIGPGLKKNAVFDMMNDQPVWLAPDSELQFIHTDHAAELVWSLLQHGIRNEIVNLGAEGLVNIGALHKRMGSSSQFVDPPRHVRYEISLDKLRRLAGKPLPHSETDVLTFLKGESL